MIGLSISNIKEGLCKTYVATEPSHLIKDENCCNHFYVSYSFYEGYPIRRFILGDYLAIIEGCIYNKSQEEIEDTLKEYVQSKNSSIVNSFVKESDGDFIVYLINVVDNELIIFNDYMGRLPLYFYYHQNRLIISRKLNFILSNISEIVIKKDSIFEYLMFEFYHGNDTLYENISKLDFHQMMIFNNEGLFLSNTSDDNYDIFIENSDNATTIANEYIESTKRRSDYFKQKGIFGGYAV